MKLFTNKPQCKEVELSIGTVCLKPLLLKHAKMFENITDVEGNAAEQHTMLTILLKELLCDVDGNDFEDLATMSPDEVKENFTLNDFATLIQAMSPNIPEDESKNVL